jgi:peptide/nickel transport system permease protein
MRRLLRDPAAIAALGVLALIVLGCLAAQLYAARVAGTDPFRSNPAGEAIVAGRRVPVLAENTGGLGLGTTPLGPTWQGGAYLLGADGQGRDVAARLLYGGRTSLLIAASAGAICLALAAVLGTVSGFLGGGVDFAVARTLDLLWAFPTYLLAISLSAVLLSGAIHIGPVAIGADSLLLPIAVGALVWVPYAARPVRGRVLALKESEFVQAAVAVGARPGRILRRHILPHVAPQLVLLAAPIVGFELLTESALSFLSIGVQAPAASWGTLIADGQTLIYSRPLVAIAPGLLIVLTVLAVNLVGEGVRNALDGGQR